MFPRALVVALSCSAITSGARGYGSRLKAGTTREPDDDGGDGTGSASRDYPDNRSSARRARCPQRNKTMKTIATLLAVAALTLAANSAEAKGCLKGAAVGGVAGHYAGHHGLLGAAAGCLYGRHRANEQARQQQDQPNGKAPVDNNKL
jgi:hypothetical protein